VATPLVSVVIPAYKAATYLTETIISVQNQTHTHLELIIIDDGSPDNQADVVAPLVASDERIRYIKQKNGGVASARNHGYRLSKGDFVAFLDADDVWLPDNIALKVAQFETKNELGLVHSDAIVFDQNSTPTGEYLKGKDGWILEDLLRWETPCIPAPSSILVKRSVIEKVGGFNTSLSNAADQEFFFRVAQYYKIGRIATPLWMYRVHDQNMHSNIALMEKDALRAYQLAEVNKLFKSKSFRNLCFANMYLIVGASWWGDGNNKSKGLQYILKSIITYPPIILKISRKFFAKKT
jgi:glycosyltransferase involved in cell wall biosynthesis